MARRTPNTCDYSCWKCRYYCFSSRTCDYYLMTKKRRQSPAGEGCDKFDTRHAGERKKFGSYMWYEPGTSAKIRTCYEQGMNDYQIGQRLGLQPYHIANWRHANKLPSQEAIREKLREESEATWI